MRFRINKSISAQVAFVLCSFWSGQTLAQVPVYLGPVAGDTSQNPSSGSDARSNTFTYGVEALTIIDHFGLGFNFSIADSGTDGTSQVSVHQINDLYEAQLRYLFLTDQIMPYASVGAGLVNQDITTQVLGVSEEQGAAYFVRDIGIGLLGRITSSLGLDISAKYYQFSNVNGFSFAISIGYFPIF